MDEFSYTEARNKLATLLERVTREHAPVVITRRNGEAAVLIGLDDFEGWRDAHYLLQNPQHARRLLDALDAIRRDAANGKGA